MYIPSWDACKVHAGLKQPEQTMLMVDMYGFEYVIKKNQWYADYAMRAMSTIHQSSRNAQRRGSMDDVLEDIKSTQLLVIARAVPLGVKMMLTLSAQQLLDPQGLEAPETLEPYAGILNKNNQAESTHQRLLDLRGEIGVWMKGMLKKQYNGKYSHADSFRGDLMALDDFAAELGYRMVEMCCQGKRIGICREINRLIRSPPNSLDAAFDMLPEYN